MSPGRRPIGTPKLTSRPTTTSTIPTTMRIRPTQLSHFHSAEEVAKLEGGGLGCVGPVRRVSFDGGAELPAKRARVGLGRIGGSHQRAPFRDGVWRLERHDDTRTG